MEQHETLMSVDQQERSNMHGYALMDPAAQKQLAQIEKSLNGVAQVFLGLTERINLLETIVQNQITITGAEARTLHDAIISRAKEFCTVSGLSYKGAGRKVRKAITHDFLLEFSISNYHDLPKKSLAFGLEYIRGWRSFALAKRLKQLPNPTGC